MFCACRPGSQNLLQYLACTYNKNISDNIWPSNKGMASILMTSVTSIKNWKKELVEGGWIHIVECVQHKQHGKSAQQSNYHYLSPSIMINYFLRRKEERFKLDPKKKLEKEIEDLKEKLEKVQEITRSKNVRPSQTASLCRIGKSTSTKISKPVFLNHGQKRSNFSKLTGGKPAYP